MKKRFLTLAVSAVDLADRRFCFSYPHEDPVVTASVRALGVIEPPVLFEHDPPGVISGWRRIWAARRAGINEVPAIVVEKEACCGMPKLELGDLDAVRKLKGRAAG